MNIEDKIFKKSNVNFKKLIDYGFKKVNNKYIYSKNIIDDTFRVDVEVSDKGKVKGKIVELSFNEEYNNFRISNMNGDFVSKVRQEFDNVLTDIKNKCFQEKYFISNQANRVCELIYEKYKDRPEFPWEKDKTSGIFRNPDSKKWYGIIMNIPRNRIDVGEDEVEIINVKLNEEKINNLVLKKGYYRAYHMNKKYWISILLDETLTDEEIMESIIESHSYTELKRGSKV